MPDIFDTVAANAPTSSSAPPQQAAQTTPNRSANPQYASGRPSGDIFDHVAAGAYDKQEESEQPSEPQGLGRVAKGVYDTTVGPVVDLAKREGEYLSKTSPDAPISEAWNDPMVQAIHGIVQSHADVAHKALDALKRAGRGYVRTAKDAVSGNLAQAGNDAYTTNADVSEGLGYGLASIVPGVGPAAAKAGEDIGKGDTAYGAGEAVGLVGSVLAPHAIGKVAGKVLPKSVEVAGDNIPTRAGSVVEKVASEKPLRQFDVSETQPAVRKVAGKIASESADTAAPKTLPREDAFGFGQTADALRGKSRPVFQKLDELSNGEFSKAQADAKLARGSLDYEGRKAYQTALDKQEALFDQYKGQISDGDLTTAKANWRKSTAMDDLRVRFNRTIHPTPVELLEKGQPDYGYVNGKQFREALVDAAQNGEFEKAGFAPQHAQDLEELGRILEKGSNIKRFSLLTRNIVNAGLSAATGHVGTAAEAFAGLTGSEHLAGNIMGKIITSPKAASLLKKAVTGSSAINIASKGLIPYVNSSNSAADSDQSESTDSNSSRGSLR